MNVIAPRTLRTFWEKHPHAEVPLRAWLRRMQKNDYETLGNLRTDFPTADLASTKAGNQVTIFNIGGNDYRLVTRVNYTGKRVYILNLMTHAEYDKWNRKGRLE